MFALAAALIGAATLAFAATARSMGAAASMARLMSAFKSRIETTSLSGRAVVLSAASSSADRPMGWLSLIADLHSGGRTFRTSDPVIPRVLGRRTAILQPPTAGHELRGTRMASSRTLGADVTASPRWVRLQHRTWRRPHGHRKTRRARGDRWTLRR